MRRIYFILNLCLSLLFIATPVLGLSFELNFQAQEKLMCCQDMSSSNQEGMNCHSDDDSKKHSCQDKCKDKCQDHAAQVLTHTIQPPTQHAQLEENNLIYSLSISSYFQDLFQQQFLPQFWNPPKNV